MKNNIFGKYVVTIVLSSVDEITFSLTPLRVRFENFTCSAIRQQGFRMIKSSLVENLKWPLVLKLANLIK